MLAEELEVPFEAVLHRNAYVMPSESERAGYEFGHV